MDNKLIPYSVEMTGWSLFVTRNISMHIFFKKQEVLLGLNFLEMPPDVLDSSTYCSIWIKNWLAEYDMPMPSGLRKCLVEEIIRMAMELSAGAHGCHIAIRLNLALEVDLTEDNAFWECHTRRVESMLKGLDGTLQPCQVSYRIESRKGPVIAAEAKKTAEHVGDSTSASGAIEGDDTCSICLTKVSSPTEKMIMPCSHFFHENCILSWLRVTTTCPLCRLPLD